MKPSLRFEDKVYLRQYIKFKKHGLLRWTLNNRVTTKDFNAIFQALWKIKSY